MLKVLTAAIFMLGFSLALAEVTNSGLAPVPLPPPDREAIALRTLNSYVYDCNDQTPFPSEWGATEYCNAEGGKVPKFWDKTLPEKVVRAIASVNHINDLHQTKVDSRFMVCLGRRESHLNPAAANCASSAVGMYQTINVTIEDLWKRGPLSSKLPNFKDLSFKEYRSQMARSSSAQTEVAVMTLFNKALSSSQEFIDKKGDVGRDVYEKLANSYFGNFDRGDSLYKESQDYKKAIRACLDCLIDQNVINQDGGITDKEMLPTCLEKAAH